MYYDATETEEIDVCETGIVTFTKKIKYLGSYVYYHLRNDYNIEQRIGRASASMGALQPFFQDPTVNLCIKYLIFCTIPITCNYEDAKVGR